MRDSSQQLLTLSQVARFLGVERRVVTNYARERGLPVIRISRNTVRVDPQQLAAWLAKRAEGETEKVSPILTADEVTNTEGTT